MVSQKDINLVSEIVSDVVLEDKLFDKNKPLLNNSFEFASKVVPILPYVKWELKDDAVEFKSHVKTLFKNQMKLDKL